MEREFRVIPIEEELSSEKAYYVDTPNSLSEDILNIYAPSIMHYLKVFDGNEFIDSGYIMLEEGEPGKVSGSIRHSFYISKDLVFTYVI